jgi:hypothetical protein
MTIRRKSSCSNFLGGARALFTDIRNRRHEMVELVPARIAFAVM